MDELIELISVYRPVQPTASVLRLIEDVRNGKVKHKSDIDYFKDNAEAEQAINRLIRQTKKALLSGIYLDTELHQVRSDYAKALVLIGKGATAIGIDVARKAFNNALKYELLYIAAHLAELLARYYVESSTSPRLQKRYSQASQEIMRMLLIENKVNALYLEVRMLMAGRSSYSAGVKAKLEEFCHNLSSLDIQTKQAHFHSASVRIIKAFSNQEYARAALICSEALKQITKSGHRTALLQIRAVAAIAAGRYDMAEQGLLEGLELTGHHLHNWQILQYYRCVAFMHAENFKKAKEIHEQATKRKQLPIIRQQWCIVQAYLWIFYGGKFRLGKFFNETIEISQDKGGHNVNIIIADLMISLTRDRDRFIHRVEAVKNYVYRHLKGKQHERTKAFLQFLFLIPDSDFNMKLVKSRGRKYLNILKNRSVYADHNLEIEIIPYMFLIEEIVSDKRKAI